VSRAQRIFFMVGLVVAGEAVFSLPFHVARFYRPTVLDAFGLTNTELGGAQSVYGVVAMVAYLFGGPFADRFSARRLLATSLAATAAGGLYMATFPGPLGMALLFGYWGATTILLFWSALIRVTREWGGQEEQGLAYGILDGGRGLVAALLTSAGVILFRLVFPEGGEPTVGEQQQALRPVIYGYSGATLAAAALVWRTVPESGPDHANRGVAGAAVNLGRILRLPSVWLQAAIVLCAYVGYKGFDNYSLFAEQAWGVGEVGAAEVSAYGVWVRPVAPLIAGMLGDRARSSRVTIAAFAILLASHLLFAWVPPEPGSVWILVTNILLACAAIFGLRGLYFALFQEARVPLAATGAAVGVVSIIGYTPDTFVNLLQGLILDASPGVAGHQQFFLFLAGFAAAGVLASVAFERLNR
jgi:sugar phosphate permease